MFKRYGTHLFIIQRVFSNFHEIKSGKATQDVYGYFEARSTPIEGDLEYSHISSMQKIMKLVLKFLSEGDFMEF